MAAEATTATPPLTLSEQLDAMLSGWLERYAATHAPGSADAVATAVVTVADPSVPEVEAFCDRWDLSVQRLRHDDGRRSVLRVEGRVLPVRGFTEITGMYRR
jgi:hypothetical protein